MPRGNQDICDELTTTADNHFNRIAKSIPNEPASCFAFLTELTRMYDFLHFGPREKVMSFGLGFQHVHVLKWGWNLGVHLLFKPMDSFQGIPVTESTHESRVHAIGFLYQLGCTTLLRRTADMIRCGILSVEEIGANLSFSMTRNGVHQFADQLESGLLERLENVMNELDSYNGWNLVEPDEIKSAARSFGNFLSKESGMSKSNFKLDDLKEKMRPLLFEWDSGKGIMLGYDSTEELDWHFVEIASKAVLEWRDESGIHPTATIGDVSASDVYQVVICLVSFNLKHIEFCKIASEINENISIPQSLTIWCSRKELEKDIADFTRMNRRAVKKVFDIIALKAQDADFLKTHTSLFMPLLIDLGNDFVLRPVASILRNPMITIKDIVQLKNPQLRSRLIESREDWFREYLYAMFMGDRYHRVNGNVTLRENGKDVTDIDGAIFDHTNGELALFQLKWQDFQTNSIKGLRSRAKNLTDEMDKWTDRTTNWISSQGTAQLARNLRLSKVQRIDASKIYLFGLSKDIIRVRGYGYEIRSKNVAVCTWPQVKRLRAEIGPAKSVFGELFKRMKQEEEIDIEVTPRPASFKVFDKEFTYEDIWVSTD